jgi:hypothetical protein
LLEDCFILLRQNQSWVGIGYCVRTNDSTGRLWLPECIPGSALGVGSLYRYSASTNVVATNGIDSDPSQLYVGFRNACVPGSVASMNISNRICDGVIHFYLATFATNGFPIYCGASSGTNAACFYINALTPYYPYYSVVRQVQAVPNFSCPGNLGAIYFWSNAVPAAVELQLGMLEQHSLDRYNSISDPTARLNYLQSTNYYITSHIHLFRQRIPIRNVNPLTYQ